MKIKYVSDLHWEFMQDHGMSQLVDLASGSPDVIIIAGDLTNAAGLEDSYTMLSGLRIPIISVLGNHELYGSSTDDVDERIAALNQLPNINILRRERIQLGDVAFCGTTLWFPYPQNKNLDGRINDFKLIRNFSPWVYDEAKKDATWLGNTVQPGDIVITHHLPSYQSVNRKYIGHILNAFFVHPLDDVMLERKPAFWIHGHSHDTCNYIKGSTNVISNPHGYIHYDVNRAWDYGKMIEVTNQSW